MTILLLGSDVADKWGISKEVRATIDKLPKDKLVEVENPFVPGEKVLALPVPQLNCAIIHIQVASYIVLKYCFNLSTLFSKAEYLFINS